jgi:hypothetical protein
MHVQDYFLSACILSSTPHFYCHPREGGDPYFVCRQRINRFSGGVKVKAGFLSQPVGVQALRRNDGRGKCFFWTALEKSRTLKSCLLGFGLQYDKIDTLRLF